MERLVNEINEKNKFIEIIINLYKIDNNLKSELVTKLNCFKNLVSTDYIFDGIYDVFVKHINLNQQKHFYIH